jgi:hypothetical protein
MERVEDRSKALSYIGIEIAEALKYIPAPVDEALGNVDTFEVAEEPVEEVKEVKNEIVAAAAIAEEKEETVAPVVSYDDNYYNETRVEVKPSLWQRIKNSKVGRAIRYIMQIRIVIDYPALPEGRGEDNY